MVANHVAISPDGNHVVVASQDRTAKVYALPTLNPVGSTLLHDGAVVEAHFRLPGASQVVTASFDGSVRVWDWRQGALVVEPMMHPGPVLFARPVMGGAYVLSLGDDRRLRLWRVDQRAPFQQAFIPLIHQPAISPVGDQLAYLDTDVGETSHGLKVMLAKLSNTPVDSSPLAEKRLIYVAKQAVERLFFSHDGNQLAIAGQGPWLAIVRTSDGVEQRLLQLPAPVERAEFARRNSLLVLQLADASLRIFDLETGRESGLPIQLSQAILDFGISQDGRWLSVATGAQLQIFDARTGYPVARIAPGGVLTAAVHPVRPEIAYASRSGLSFWRPALDSRGVRKDQYKSAQATSKAAREMGSGEGVSVHTNKLLVDLRFTPDGNTLAAYSVDGLAWTWNVSTFEQGPFMRHSNSIVAMNLSGDGRWLTTTTLDGIARIWDFRTGQIMTDALSLGDSERELKIVATGTWALVRAAAQTNDTQPSGKPESGHVGYALQMLGLGFDTSPPAWFVPTVAATVNGGMFELAQPGANKNQTPSSVWWESWLQYAKTKNGVREK
jgi:WD40 repeat protein